MTKLLTKQLAALLVDDESASRKALRRLLKAHPVIKVIDEADGVEAAMSLIERLEPDVIFLDVQMPKHDGFELVNRLASVNSVAHVVFVTAYDSYAIRAFEANALDYLTKPVVPGRLALTIERLEKLATLKTEVARNGEQKSSNSHYTSPKKSDSLKRSSITPPEALPSSPEEVFVLKDRNITRIVRAREVHAVIAESPYTLLRIHGGHEMMVREAISTWEQRLPRGLFFKVSRGLIINRTSIRSLEQIDRNTAELNLKEFPEPIVLSRLEGQRMRKVLAGTWSQPD